MPFLQPAFARPLQPGPYLQLLHRQAPTHRRSQVRRRQAPLQPHPTRATHALADVLTFGAQKYALTAGKPFQTPLNAI